MLQLGILLASVSALLCGWGDVCASQGAKRVGAGTATLLALLMGTLVLALMGTLAFGLLGLSWRGLVLSFPLGLIAGTMTSIGYSAGYKGMARGPLVVVSPIIATDGAIAGLLAVLLLHERVDTWQVATLIAIFIGVLLAATSVPDLLRLLHTRERGAFSTWSGVPWGAVGALAFGVMLFALGAGSRSWGWFFSMLWSRLIAAAVLAVIAVLKWLRQARRPGEILKRPRGARRFHLKVGPCLALGGGVCETVGLAMFSLGAQLTAHAAIVSMVASSFVLIPLVFGALALGERPASSQWMGVALVIGGLTLLGIKPA